MKKKQRITFKGMCEFSYNTLKNYMPIIIVLIWLKISDLTNIIIWFLIIPIVLAIFHNAFKDLKKLKNET